MNYKKAGSILLLISGILAILGGAGLLIAGVVFFTMKDNPEIRNALIQGLDNGTITSTLPGTHAQQAEQIQTVMFPSMAISFIIAAICASKASFCSSSSFTNWSISARLSHMDRMSDNLYSL